MVRLIVARRNSVSRIQTTQALQASLAALLGISLFICVAMSHPTVIHNAAHDSRHSIAVPCH